MMLPPKSSATTCTRCPLTTQADPDLPEKKRPNHAYAHTALKPLMSIVLLGGVI
jgi:hypothetical protein